MIRISNNIKAIVCYAIVFSAIVALNIATCVSTTNSNNRDNDNVADSLTTIIGSATDSINTLDSLRNVYIDEAHTLSDSDAIKLFYQLLSK